MTQDPIIRKRIVLKYPDDHAQWAGYFVNVTGGWASGVLDSFRANEFGSIDHARDMQTVYKRDRLQIVELTMVIEEKVVQ